MIVNHFLSQLATIPNPRRAEGKLYQLPHVLLFSIFAIVKQFQLVSRHPHLHQGPSATAEQSL